MSVLILVANANKAALCKAASIHQPKPDLQLIKRFDHPQSRQKVSELIDSDHSGQSRGNGVGGGFPESDVKEVEAETFARELMDSLTASHNKQHCDSLLLIASPHFLGLLNKSNKLKSVDVKTISKDYVHLDLDDLSAKIGEHIFGEK